MASHHRGHGHCIAKGARLDLMMAELMGRESGYCQGLGGSMHIADLGLNILGANGIVGAAMPLSTGAGLAARLDGTGRVAVAFFGDGAANQGVFHESLNLASVWKLPLVFVCENNQYALSTSFRDTTSVDQVAERAVAYGIPGRTIDGNDVVEVYEAVREAVERARAGEGPTLIEAMTYRWGGHSMRANIRDPRSEEEYAAWMERDPVQRVERELKEVEIADEAGIESIGSEVVAELDEAVEFGRAADQPAADVLGTAVYAPHEAFEEPALANGNGRTLGFVDALNEALHQEMESDSQVVVMGEDVGATGGIFGATKGLMEKFGAERVRDTPISEAGFVGCGIGAAIAGLRPVVEIQIFDFVALTMDMLVNQAAKFRFMLGGKNTVPVVIRGPQGGGIRMAAQHSQSLEAWFTHVPGLVVVAPSGPYEAKGLLAAAIRDPNPVIFLEAKLQYLEPAAPVPEEPYAIPIGKAAVKREGTDVTLVATMAMVPRALAAAESLARQGHSVEVIDPRTLKPLDEETLLASVRKTRRLVVAHEACLTGGFGAEVAALVAEKAFDWLDAPVARVAALDTPMPYNEALERAVIPSQQRIADAVRETLAY
jgi:2-oxoisovalerate dehydrogenase E1 component